MLDFSAIISNPLTIIVLSVSVLSFLYLVLYYGIFYYRVAKYRLNKKDKDVLTAPDSRKPSVSVVVTAHNDSELLKKGLVYLLEQEYEDYEVVVVNYVSQDDTKFVLRVCSENYPCLKVVNFPEDVNMFQGKKYPLSLGIKSAQNDIIICTDPECIPQSFVWVNEMVKEFTDKTNIVLGYSGISKEKGFFNAMQQYDNITRYARCLGSAICGMPYTGNGHNLAFRRSFFFESKGFISHYSEQEGADDLFVNKNANKSNTAVALHPDSFVMVDPDKNMKNWKQRRKRRFAPLYLHPKGEILLRSLYPMSLLLFYVSVVFIFVFKWLYWQIPLLLLLLKWMWQCFSSRALFTRFGVKKLFYAAPLFELYFLFADTILSTISLIGKK